MGDNKKQLNYKWLENSLKGIENQLKKANQLKRLEIETNLLIKKEINHEEVILTELNEVLQDE